MDPSVDGMKTGHTSSAGYCLVSIRPSRRAPPGLGGAGCGLGLRARRESLKLLNFGYQFYETVKLYSADEALSKFRVWKGKLNERPVRF